MKTGIELIAEERQEQITKHGRTIERDIENNPNGELIVAAIGMGFGICSKDLRQRRERTAYNSRSPYCR